MNDKLEHVKVGDTIATPGYGRSITLYVVDRMTATHVICGAIKFRKRDGRRVGYTGYYGGTAFVPTAEDIAKHVKEQAIDRVRGFSRDELERLSKDTLVAFINAVRDAKK